MPGVVEEGPEKRKRKHENLNSMPVKRARPEDQNDSQGQILLLESKIFESKKNYNSITTLLEFSQQYESNPDDALIAYISLCRVFVRLMASGAMSKKKEASEKEAVVIAWLNDRFSEYKQSTITLLGSKSAASTLLTLLMKILKAEASRSDTKEEYIFPTKLLQDILRSLLSVQDGTEVCLEFGQTYMEEFDDIRYYAFEAIGKLLNENPLLLVDNALTILSAVETAPDSKEDIEDFYVPEPKKTSHKLYSLSAHKKMAQSAWLALMKLNMSKENRKTLLGMMSTTIAPWFMKPELLMDFLTDSYNAGGATSLLALSGVFYLIQERNLDYPSFYRKLYSLLDAGMLHSKHRSKFFRLLDTFMASTHLPAALVASFIKRLARLTLFAPPAGIVAVVPWIYNLLKRHPSCTLMIHREVLGKDAQESLEQEGMNDPFKADEKDPMETNAIGSSLWEIVMLQSHYHPNVATLAKIISEQFTKHSYNLEDFLDHSYGSMLEAELSKEVKKEPVVEFEIPKRIFMKQDADLGVADSLLVRLWNFS